MTYRRRIHLASPEPAVAVGDLEDDFHRFRVTLRHDGSRIQEITGEALRSPWTTCPDAADPLRELEGSELSTLVTAASEVSDPRANCTHLFDLAGLTIAHAASGRKQRRYDTELPPRDRDTQIATLQRDGEVLMTWTLAWNAQGKRVCIDPPPFSETQWRGGFIRWAADTLDADTAEAAVILRRACDIGLGHGMDLDRYDHPSEIEYPMAGICFTMQPERISVAERNRGTIRDFTDTPDALLADLTGDGPMPEKPRA